LGYGNIRESSPDGMENDGAGAEGWDRDGVSHRKSFERSLSKTRKMKNTILTFSLVILSFSYPLMAEERKGFGYNADQFNVSVLCDAISGSRYAIGKRPNNC